MDKKLNKINFHKFFEICTALSGIHFFAQFISLCIYAIRVGNSDYYGEVSGLQLIGNIIYSALPTFFTFVILLGITLLYNHLIPKKVKEEVVDEVADKIVETIEETTEEVKAIPEYNLKMKKAELLELADSLNIKVNKSVKKEDIIKALDEGLK